jgi:hypothetical protein
MGVIAQLAATLTGGQETKAYSQDSGWRRDMTGKGMVYTGYYRVPGLRYSGWVSQKWSGTLLFYILNPPIALLRETEFGGCFHFAGNDGWWLISFRPEARPPDVDSGVAAIQLALRQAFVARAAKRTRRR